MIDSATQQAIDENRYSIDYGNTKRCDQEHELKVVPLQRSVKFLGKQTALRKLPECLCPLAERVGIDGRRICAHAIDADDIGGQPMVDAAQLIHPDPFFTEAKELHSLGVISNKVLASVHALVESITDTDDLRRMEISTGIPLVDELKGSESAAKIAQNYNHAALIALQRTLLDEIDQYLVEHDERFASQGVALDAA